jgi:O-antigen/teichoic acid export membrane protein
MINFSKNLINNILPKNIFSRRVSILVGGSATGQIFVFVSAPILTRIYTPDEFGLFALYVSMLALIGTFSSLRYPISIPLPKNDIDAANITALSLTLVVITSLIALAMMVLFDKSISQLLPAFNNSEYIWLLPIGILLSGIYSVFEFWSVRKKNFNQISKIKISQAFAMIAIQLMSFKLGSIGLLLGKIAEYGVGFVLLLKTALVNPIFKSVSWQNIKRVAKRYQQFPIYSSPGGFIDIVSTRFIVIAIFAYFGPAAAGMLIIAERILQMPISLISGAISQVFLSSAPAVNRRGDIKTLVETVNIKLIHLGALPALLVFLSGPEIFSLIFGENWRLAGEFAKWMSPWLYLQFISSPLNMVFAVLEKMKQLFFWQVILLSANFIGILFGILTHDVLKTVIILSLLNAACYAFLLIWILYITNIKVMNILNSIFHASIVAIICNSPLIITNFFFDISSVTTILAFLSSLILIFCRYYFFIKK